MQSRKVYVAAAPKASESRRYHIIFVLCIILPWALYFPYSVAFSASTTDTFMPIYTLPSSSYDKHSHAGISQSVSGKLCRNYRGFTSRKFTKADKMTLVQPTVEMQQHIRTELNEDVSTREKDLEHIKEWLRLQPHLPQFQDDARIMTFLRGCKFSLEKTKRKLDMYFTMRAAVPEFFSNRDPTLPEIKEVMKVANVPPLPGLTPNGRRVVMMSGVDLEQMAASVADGMKVVLMIGDIRLKEENVGVAGDVYILDASVATPQNFANHFAKFTPSLIKKFLICVQEAYPVKLKEVHVINVSPLVDTIINFVKPFLKEKIRNRIHVHSSLDSLNEFVPREMLPEEYGGKAGPMADINRQWYEKMVTYKDWFKEQEKIKADESRRPGKPKTHDDLFGMEGSFKQLSID